MSRDPIKLTIGLGFTGVLALMGLISFISLSQMNTITEQTSTLLDETNAKISTANSMRDYIRLRGDTLYKMYLTDDYFERDELRLEISIHALNYKKSRDNLYSFHMSAREAKLLDQLMKQTRIAKVANDTAADNLLSIAPLEDIKNDMRIANEARSNMLAGLTQLVTLQEEIARSTINNTISYQETVRSIVLLLSLAAFFVAVFIAQLVIRETSKKNSEEFNHRLNEAFKTATDNNENHALCFLDLDKFKIINDSCGHKAGDALLIQITKIIKSNIRSHDTLARIGGDEFGLLFECCSLDKAIELAEGVVSLIKNYEFKWEDRKFHIGVSIGMVMITKDTDSIEKALSQADIACYAAKDMGRGQIQVHGLTDDRALRLQKELSWVADINNTETSKHFSLYLQAIENIQAEHTPAMYEVLLRLNDSQNGTFVSPGYCIPTAERFNLMKDVDRWVIDQTFKHLSELYNAIPDCDVRLFINISANSLANSGFSDYVIQQYKKYNIVYDAVCLEISETKAVKNINQTADVIATLRRYNIKFALDDFGAGISSFSYLKNMPVDYLKIDGKIIKNMSHNTADKAMVAAINQIGKVMNIEIIAKHVENVFTLNQLKEIGIDYAQGFYLDKPKDINEQIQDLKASDRTHSLKH